jgi:competence ComEA-like helix-hairpin-helix protein
MFSFSTQERQVILFLVITAIAATGINNLSNKLSAVKSLVSFDQELGKININTADNKTLTGLPGIGDKLAGRIVVFRQGQGNFKSIEELKKIKGINGYRFEKIKNLVIAR